MHTETGDLIRDGEIQVPEEPGLGVTIDPDTVEDHLAPGEELFDL
jgi:L-alanine-DL-glutamate epimerase-like enolase superfamily enzyme